MTSDPDLHLRLSRVENDRDSLYDLVGELRGEFNDFRGEFDDFRGETRVRFDLIDTHLELVDTRFDRIEGTLTEVLRRLPEPA